MVDDDGREVESVGHGYVSGRNAWCVDAVRKARKDHHCDGVLRAVDSSDSVSPMTGDSILCGHTDDCTGRIATGDLHVVLILNDVENFGTYWTTWRTCLPCALHHKVVAPNRS